MYNKRCVSRYLPHDMLETKDIGRELPRSSIYYDFRFKIAFKELQPLMLASLGWLYTGGGVAEIFTPGSRNFRQV